MKTQAIICSIKYKYATAEVHCSRIRKTRLSSAAESRAFTPRLPFVGRRANVICLSIRVLKDSGRPGSNLNWSKLGSTLDSDTESRTIGNRKSTVHQDHRTSAGRAHFRRQQARTRYRHVDRVCTVDREPLQRVITRLHNRFRRYFFFFSMSRRTLLVKISAPGRGACE